MNMGIEYAMNIIRFISDYDLTKKKPKKTTQ